MQTFLSIDAIIRLSASPILSGENAAIVPIIRDARPRWGTPRVGSPCNRCQETPVKLIALGPPLLQVATTKGPVTCAGLAAALQWFVLAGPALATEPVEWAPISIEPVRIATASPEPIATETLEKWFPAGGDPDWRSDHPMVWIDPSPTSTTHLQALPTIPGPVGHGPYASQLDRVRIRASELSESPEPIHPAIMDPADVDLEMWWNEALTVPLGFAPLMLSVDVNSLAQTALASSPYIRGIMAEPRIRQNDLVVADSDFDSLAFVEGKFADTNEPIGDLLTTGFVAGRFRDETFSSSAGIRKKARSGGALELVQRGGFQDNNSTFLLPNPQGTTRLELNYSQPLMRDRGRAVNNIGVLLAGIDVQVATSQLRGELEDHLFDVTTAYWNLFQSRAEWLQRRRLLDRAIELGDILEARGEVDSQQRQILRARAAIASRRADLVRAETSVLNTQARLRLLTGDPRMIQSPRLELLPKERPLTTLVSLSGREATITALDNRPDITQAIRTIQATSARHGVAKNQILPRLDLILSTYVAGLDDNSNTLGAFTNQFTDGRPSYAAGLVFERPVGNRAARARLARNRWEMTRALSEFEQTTEVAFTEIEIAVRETQTSFNEMIAKKQAIDAAEREVQYLKQRWEHLPDPAESAVLLIEDLLDAQERLADEERSMVAAQVSYAVSWVQLRKVMGVLLRMDDSALPAIEVVP